LQQLFLIHGAILIAAALIFARGLPVNLWLCAVAIHMTVPMLILVKGNQSAIYLIDLLAPVLALYAIWSLSPENAAARAVKRTLVALLLVIPMTAGAMAYALSNIQSVDHREVLETLLWFFRNLVFLCVFVFAARQRLSGERAIALIKLVLLLSSLSAALSMVSYFGPVNLAVFEMLSAQRDAQWTMFIESSRIGTGFLGLFRAAVGQWYVCVVLLAVASLSVLRAGYRLVAIAAIVLGIGVILLSYSRAGVVGLGVGLLALAVIGGGRGQKIAAVVAVVIAGVWLWFQADLVGARFESIAQAQDDASVGRLHIWGLSLKLFGSDLGLLLSGVGPASRERVYELIGGYGAHNEYIDIVYRMGILGPIVLSIVLFLIARTLWSRRKLPDAGCRTFCTGVLAVLLANCVMGLTQDHLIHDYSAHAAGVFVYFLYGLALAIGAERTAESAARTSSAGVTWSPPNLMGSRLS
jgi:O-antigen ligase